ncbi:MAG: ABC transporter permease [Bacteroidales bacterium]
MLKEQLIIIANFVPEITRIQFMRRSIFRKPVDYSGSLGQIAWQKFKRNRLSMIALCFIILAVLVAVSGYLITPDKTHFANRQYLELSARKPGFKVKMLKVRKNKMHEKKGFLQTMLYGRESQYRSIPYYQSDFKEDHVSIELFTGDKPNAGMEQQFSYANIAFAVDTDKASEIRDGQLLFTDISGERQEVNLEELKEQLRSENFKEHRFLLGSDRFGRDLLSRLLIGTRVSLSVGFISVLISLIIGITLGSVAGFFRGWVDDLIIWLINVVWSIPTLLLVIAITFALGKGFWQIFIAVGMTMWVEVARVVRGQVISLREKEFIEAAKALGYQNARIIIRHILPNVMGAVIVISAANFASAILIEAGLSFLGIGVQPPMPSWGTMIKEHYAYIILDSAYLAILPGIAIMLMVLAFMLVGNGLRDALDVKAVKTRQ